MKQSARLVLQDTIARAEDCQSRRASVFQGKYRTTIGIALANSAESDHGCTSRIYFDNADDNVMLYNVALTSQKQQVWSQPKQTVIIEVFFNKISL